MSKETQKIVSPSQEGWDVIILPPERVRKVIDRGVNSGESIIRELGFEGPLAQPSTNTLESKSSN